MNLWTVLFNKLCWNSCFIKKTVTVLVIFCRRLFYRITLNVWFWIMLTNATQGKSSRSKVFCKKGVLKNFIKFTGKRLKKSHSFHSFINFTKFLRTPFYIKHLTAADKYCPVWQTKNEKAQINEDARKKRERKWRKSKRNMF